MGDIQQKDFLPVYFVRPNYPRKAQQRGVEGYVIIKLTVTKQGGVRDPIIIDERQKKWDLERQHLRRPRS